MPAPVPDHLRNMIQADMEAGYGNEAILAGGYGVSRRTVERYRHSFNCYGLVSVPRDSNGGRPYILSDLYTQELLGFLAERPSAYLDEMAYFLMDEFDLVVSLPTIHRALKRSRWSRKVQRKIAAQRNAQLRSHWLLSVLPKYRPEQLIFLDESAACERTGMCGDLAFCYIVRRWLTSLLKLTGNLAGLRLVIRLVKC
jgi:transposase